MIEEGEVLERWMEGASHPGSCQRRIVVGGEASGPAEEQET